MNIKLHFILSVFLGGFFTVSAQDAVVRTKIATLSNKDKIKFERFVAKANETYSLDNVKFRTAELGYPMSYKDVRGNIVYAVGVNSFGDIIYLSNFNSRSRAISNVNSIAPDGELGLNLDGTGMNIGIWDGDVALASHIEFAGSPTSRVQMKDTPRTNSSLSRENIEARQHATHVAGTVGASGVDVKAKGMAPNATIISYNWNNDAAEMIAEASKGLLVSNHSYGTPATNEYGIQVVADYYFGAYEDRAAEIDGITYMNRYYLPIQAAGNDGWYGNIKPNKNKNGNELILSSSTAKNNVVVAAVEVVSTPYTNPNSIELAIFNSNGPTNDFRIKPDIAAKGVDVFSSSFKNNTIYNYYESMDGTSMAAPGVTGIVGLWQQWAIAYNNMPYLSATIKAIMINSAMEAGDNVGPDHKFGWGLIDARKGVEVMIDAKAKRNAIVEELTLNDKETKSVKFKVGPNGTMFKTTIAWTDPESEVKNSNFSEAYVKQNPLLVNDLDLRVFKDGQEFLPWKLNKDFDNLVVLKADNDVDNVEQVEIESPSEGVYEIVITHKKSLKGNMQDFSLVATTDAEIIDIVDPGVVGASDKFIFYPNPVGEYMDVKTPKDATESNTQITIFDVNGRLVGKKTIEHVDLKEGNRVDMTGLNSGVYFIEFKNGSIKAMDKMVKK